ncbi:hypothetical protein, partial [uncultured Acidaminococcus sp.]|uniref:hypothetical protein n=1 Tax=uncultured Acidaminococcus sp. TaxID=352152 RepID=UPI00262C7C43
FLFRGKSLLHLDCKSAYVEPLDETISQIDFDSGFTESKGSVQPGGSCPEASDFRLRTSD